jgi:uncharacterized protein YidB (DUF937 family)
MFETLLNLVKEHAGEAIVNNPAIPNEKNNDAIHSAASSIVNGLQSQIASGNFKDVLNMLGGKSAVNQNPVASKLSQNVIGDLSSKFGLDSSQAGSIVSSILPGILSSLVSKTNDPNDNSLDLSGIFNNLTGGKSSGIDFGKMLDKDGDGSSMDDISEMLGGGAKDVLKNSGSLGNILGGVFDK